MPDKVQKNVRVNANAFEKTLCVFLLLFFSLIELIIDNFLYEGI